MTERNHLRRHPLRAPKESHAEREARLARHPTHGKTAADLRLMVYCRHTSARTYDAAASDAETAGDLVRAGKLRSAAARARQVAAELAEGIEAARVFENTADPRTPAVPAVPIAELPAAAAMDLDDSEADWNL